MSSVDEYRTNAEDCLRIANEDERDRTLWITLAQSWLRLAEHAKRLRGDAKPAQPERKNSKGGRSATLSKAAATPDA